MLGWVRIETQCCSLIGRERYQLSVTDECRIRSGDGRLDSPHVRKSRHLGLAVRHGVPSFISMKSWIPARTLAHLQIAAAAHLGGDLGRDAARPAFIGIEPNDAERIGILAG